MKKSNIIIGLVVLLVTTLFLMYSYYNYMLSSVGSDEEVIFQVQEGLGANQVIDKLYDEGLIKNRTAVKIYLRMNEKYNFQAGYYELSKLMDSRQIVDKIVSGDAINPNQISITFPEGLQLDQIAKIYAEVTNYSEDDIMKWWNSKDFTDRLIEEYWFITDEIYGKDVKHPLSGYLYGDTYFFNDNTVKPDEVAIRMIENLGNQLEKHREFLENESELSIHEILTLASIVEYEAYKDDERKMVAGVFYNRLNLGMKLQSCATLDIALGVHKVIYTTEDTKVIHPYNTYYINGLPPGPGPSPSIGSIDATIDPSSHDYLYFVADIYGDGQTHYAKTYQEHERNVDKYLR